MEHGVSDAKLEARVGALTLWAAEAARAGLQVPAPEHLELVAVAKNTAAMEIQAPLVESWAETLNWLMKQAAFGVVDPHSQLPEELRLPVASGEIEVIAPVVVVPVEAPSAEIPVPKSMEGSENKEVATPASKIPKWESLARDQVRDAIKRYIKPLQDLKARDANEGDTRLVVTDILCEGLDYDKFKDLTTEYMVKQDFADYGVRIDKQLVAFIEVKRISQKLNERHLRQVQMYAVNEGVEWMILTNGSVWQAYHLTGGLPVIVNMAFEIDLLGPASLEEKAELMFLLHREALKRRRIDESWKHRAATEPHALLDLILSEAMLDQMRKEVKRRSGITTTAEALSEVIRSEIVDPKLLAKFYKA